MRAWTILVALVVVGCSGTHPECASDADCARPAFCDLALERCTTDCRTGPRVALSIPRVRVHFAVTLAGATPPSLHGFPHVAGPMLELVAPGEAHGAFVDVYAQPSSSAADALVPAASDVDVVPGEYDVRYQFGGDTPGAEAWPAEGGAVIAHVSITRDDETFPIDVPVARLDVSFTLGGDSTLPPYESVDYLTIPLTGQHGGATGVRVCDGTGPCTNHASALVIPDIYDATLLGAVSPNALWPTEHGTTIATGIDITRDRATTIDIPVVHVSFAPMHGGAPLDPSTLGERGIHVTPGSGFSVPLGTPVAMLPGTHTLWLESDDHRAVPGSLGMVTIGPGGYEDGATIPVEIDLVNIALTVTMNGAPLPADCFEFDVHSMLDPDVTLVEPSALSLVRGTYTLVIESICDDTLGSALVTNTLVADHDGSQSFDVHTATLTLDLSGSPPAPTSTSAAELVLTERSGGGSAFVNLYRSASLVSVRPMVALPPGTYDIVLLGSIGNTVDYPTGPVGLVAGYVLTQDATLALDLPSITTSVGVAIEGASMGTDMGAVSFTSRAPITGFPIPAPKLALRAAPMPIASVLLPPTTYDLRYAGIGMLGAPAGAADLGCWTVSP